MDFTNIFSKMVNGYSSFIECTYNSYMNWLDMCFVFINKNREAFDHSRNSNMDSLNAYMQGYEKAKKEFCSTSTSTSPFGETTVTEKDPASIYF